MKPVSYAALAFAMALATPAVAADLNYKVVAHVDPEASALLLRDILLKHLEQLQDMAPAERLKLRYAKFRNFGHVLEKNPAAEKPEAAANVAV